MASLSQPYGAEVVQYGFGSPPGRPAPSAVPCDRVQAVASCDAWPPQVTHLRLCPTATLALDSHPNLLEIRGLTRLDLDLLMCNVTEVASLMQCHLAVCAALSHLRLRYCRLHPSVVASVRTCMPSLRHLELEMVAGLYDDNSQGLAIGPRWLQCSEALETLHVFSTGNSLVQTDWPAALRDELSDALVIRWSQQCPRLFAAELRGTTSPSAKIHALRELILTPLPELLDFLWGSAGPGRCTLGDFS